MPFSTPTTWTWCPPRCGLQAQLELLESLHPVAAHCQRQHLSNVNVPMTLITYWWRANLA
jgi:hypothetical protein